MTTIEIDDQFIPATTRRPVRGGPIRRWLAAMRRRRVQHVTLTELSRMQAHLLRDMGIEFGDVCDALDGRRNSVLFNPLRKPERD